MLKALPLFAMALTAALAQPQRPANGGNPPDPATIAQRRVAFLTQQLSLTESQQQQATTIFTNAATSEATNRESLRTAHESLSDAIKKNDAAAIDQASTTIGTLTAQNTATDAKANAAFYQILTADQQAKFPVGMGMGMGMGGGFGGRMGPGAQGGRGPRR